MSTEPTEQDTDIENRIRCVLEIYPRISPSMLQIGIGTSIPANWWRPVYRSMIDRGDIILEHIVALGAAGRSNTYTVVSLKPK